jgi:hypothetical protein
MTEHDVEAHGFVMNTNEDVQDEGEVEAHGLVPNTNEDAAEDG